jgi:2-oxoacid:acceptor oxidoreductase gamma subunit (pyruvate/2-ketoisovalerate family)
MHEMCLYGRGGQGVVTAAEIISESLVLNGKYIASFPMFGVERRGAPVTAFVRFDEKPIRIKSRIYHPDCILLFDSRMLHLTDIYAGLKPGSIMVANTSKLSREELHINVSTLGLVDATRIGITEMGSPIVNTGMIGAFAAVTGWISIDSILLAIAGRYKDELRTKNQRCARAGFEEVIIEHFDGSCAS